MPSPSAHEADPFQVFADALTHALAAADVLGDQLRALATAEEIDAGAIQRDGFQRGVSDAEEVTGRRERNAGRPAQAIVGAVNPNWLVIH